MFNHLMPIMEDAIVDKPYVAICFDAMKEISLSLEMICNLKKDGNEVEGDLSQIYERNYIISLAVLLAQKQMKLDTIGLTGFINGEVAKQLSLAGTFIKDKYIEIRKNIDRHYKGNKKEIFVLPDLLIHESHSYEKKYLDERYQHVVIEAKTNRIKRKELFHLDLLKLNYYLETLHYADAIYVILGTPVDIIDTYLGEYINNVKYYTEEKKGNLYFFIQEKLKSEPSIFLIK